MRSTRGRGVQNFELEQNSAIFFEDWGVGGSVGVKNKIAAAILVVWIDLEEK